jgi:guanylate kinase
MNEEKDLKNNPKSEIRNPKSTERIQNKLIIVSAPSGAGKTTIVKHLLSQALNLGFSVSATSRKPRSNEKEGIDYYYISDEEFKRRIENEEFLEWEEVYPGILYGTLRNEVNRLLRNEKNVIFDVDVVGGLDLKEIYQTRALAIFVSPPSLVTLRERLMARSTETPEKIAIRVAKAASEMKFARNFDVILVNDNLNVARKEAEHLVMEFLNQR